jgi:hypothetical protein
VQQVAGTPRDLRIAVEQGDYVRAVNLAAALAPGTEPQLDQFRIQMEVYDRARAAADYRKALRALADARMAAIAAGFPELEAVITDRLYEVVKLHGGRRA